MSHPSFRFGSPRRRSHHRRPHRLRTAQRPRRGLGRRPTSRARSALASRRASRPLSSWRPCRRRKWGRWRRTYRRSARLNSRNKRGPYRQPRHGTTPKTGTTRSTYTSQPLRPTGTPQTTRPTGTTRPTETRRTRPQSGASRRNYATHRGRSVLTVTARSRSGWRVSASLRSSP